MPKLMAPLRARDVAIAAPETQLGAPQRAVAAWQGWVLDDVPHVTQRATR